MPHINRIRVNNVKYNFGTQAYEDFMMKPFGHNTLYDLANGGGKSVLMLLMLQTVLPNCTLDEKQPLEKLFRTGDGSGTIHSLIEWKLDEGDIENGYQYMTTGFCAKKSTSEVMIEEAEAETAAIEYFNYCIFYREYNENDIRNLPLSKEKEKITYSGLKKYLKELERDPSLKVFIFDRKREYQEFISNYGLYESEWEIIRGINKTEGHVRTYFESNYRTTRKVVEDLLIEEIIQKSFLRKSRDQDDSMSKTLLAIRDKLAELTKQKQTIGNYDRQIELLTNFSERLVFLGRLYEQKEEMETLLLELKGCADASVKRQEEQILQEEAVISSSQEEITNLYTRAERAKIYRMTCETEKLLKAVTEEEKKVSKVQEELNEVTQKRNLLLCMNDYQDYLKDKQGRNEILETIQAVQESDCEISEKLGFYTACAKEYITIRVKELKKQEEELLERAIKIQKELSVKEERDRELTKQLLVGNTLIQSIEKQKEELLLTIAKLQSKEGILVFDDIPKKIEACRHQTEELLNKQSAAEKKEKELRKEQEGVSVHLAENEFLLRSLIEQEKEKEKFFAAFEKESRKANQILLAYGQKDFNELLKEIHDRTVLAISEVKSKTSEAVQLKEAISCLDLGEFPLDSVLKNMIHSLSVPMQEKIMTGADFLNQMDPEQRAELYYLYPFLPYSLVIKDSECSVEELLQVSQELSEYVVLAVYKTAIFEKKEIPGTKDVMVLYKDQSLLFDEKRLNEEKIKLSYQLSECERSIVRMKDQIKTYSEDEAYVHVFVTTQKERYQREQKASQSIKEKTIECRQLIEKMKNEQKFLLAKEEELREHSNQTKQELSLLSEEIKLLNKLDETVGLYEKLKEQSSVEKEKLFIREQEKEKLEPALKSLVLLKDQIATQSEQIAKEMKTLESLWELKYKVYEQKEHAALPAEITEEIFDKLNAMIAVIEKKHTNLEDKNRLLATYIQGMNKNLKNIKERQIAISELEERNRNNLLITTSVKDLDELKEKQEALEHLTKELTDRYHEVKESYYRMDAAREQLIRLYEQRFKAYEKETFTDVNIQIFLEEMEKIIKEKEEKLKKDTQVLESLKKEMIALTNCQKDICRFLNDTDREARFSEKRIMSVKELEEELLKLTKELSQSERDSKKKQEEFEVNKGKLIEVLKLLDAGGLALEIQESVRLPYTKKEVESLILNIDKVNECLVLEKNRIISSIRNIEAIKENFENQCLQRCEHVKTELERLKKLSSIKLDHELIPMIELSIPYVKQEFYKDRMSGYIDKIVTEADGFIEVSERLKYIRNALSLKRLFSVIVTDMNAIRLNLYKRERIKELSRHLRYEEAVGSTGQSQGIYIQFLIAIITYISNINSRKAENTRLLKVIFIDNPFGAAKDIYIWEPIFELLKQNQVQLIVPARGTTPAITSKFDVNYILGQKLINQRQQTVIVDYHSSIDAQETEYIPLAYEQTSFDLF